MFVVTLTYLKPLSEVDKNLPAHRDFLKKCYQQNLFLASGPMNPRTGGILIVRSMEKSKLFEILENDPFKKNGIASYEIVEFEPVLHAEAIKDLV